MMSATRAPRRVSPVGRFWTFVPRRWGGYEMPSPVSARGLYRTTVRIYHPATTDSARAAAERYYRWTSSAVTVMVVGLIGILVWRLVASVGDWRVAALAGVVVAGGTFAAGALTLRRRARVTVSRTRSLPVEIVAGRSHWFKPDEPAGILNEDLADVVDLVEQVDVLRDEGLIEEGEWRELWGAFWSHAGRHPSARDALGWGEVVATAHALVACARRRTLIHCGLSEQAQ